MNHEAVRKALSGMYVDAFNMGIATDSPRAMTASMRGLGRLNRLHFEPEPSGTSGVTVVEEQADGTRRVLCGDDGPGKAVEVVTGVPRADGGLV